MRPICLTALVLSVLSGSAFADPLAVTVYPYGQPAYPPQPAPPQYYVVQTPQYGAAPAPRSYAAPAPRSYAAAPAPSGPGGGGFLAAIFGGPTVNVPVSHIFNFQAPQQQPEAAAMPQQQAYAPADPQDAANYPIDPKFTRQVVAYNGDEKPGTIIVDTPDKFLFLVEDDGKALRYGIGVGRPGFTWSGVKAITAMKKWPDWTPPPEMIARQPGIPHFMAGGIGNPLGARALYLGSTLYRIHGSNEPWTIGQNVSSGCIRMRNEDVEDLYDRVKIGTKVVIL